MFVEENVYPLHHTCTALKLKLKYVLVQTFTDFIELKYYVNICAINAKQNLFLRLFVLNVVSAVVLNHMSSASVREAAKFSPHAS